jgi:hypothetical protein
MTSDAVEFLFGIMIQCVTELIISKKRNDLESFLDL